MSTPFPPPPDPERPEDSPSDQPPANPWGESPAGSERSQPPVEDAPPPPPAYGTPPAAGSGGYSGFPPPPPPPTGQYAATPAAPASDIGTAMSIAWSRLWKNVGVILGAFLIWGVGVGLVIGLAYWLLVVPSVVVAGSDSDVLAAAGAGVSVGVTIVFGIIAALAGYLAQIGIINGALSIVDNSRARLGDFFTFRNVGPALVVGVLLALAYGLLSFTWVGPLAVAFFAMFALYFAIDRGLGVADSFKASTDIALKNVVPVILLVLIVQLAAPIVGAFLCVIGLLVTLPWAMLTTAVFYRRVTGGTVAA